MRLILSFTTNPYEHPSDENVRLELNDYKQMIIPRIGETISFE